MVEVIPWYLRLDHKITMYFHLIHLGYLLLEASTHAARKPRLAYAKRPHGEMMTRCSGWQQSRYPSQQSAPTTRHVSKDKWPPPPLNHGQRWSLPRWDPRHCRTETTFPTGLRTNSHATASVSIIKGLFLHYLTLGWLVLHLGCRYDWQYFSVFLQPWF